MKNMILKNATLISVSDRRDKIEHNVDIEINDGIVVNIGNNLDCNDKEVIDCTGKIITPGFINTHTHLPMVIFKDSIDGLKLEDWLENFIWPAEAKLTSDDIYYASLLSSMEMISNGITTIHDMYFEYESILKATKEIGLDIVVSRTLMNNDSNGEKRIKDFLSLMDKYKDTKFTLGIHGLYTSDEEYIKRVTDLARELNMRVHMHFCETKEERNTIINNFNVTHPTEVLEKYFQDLDLVFAHSVKLDDYDINILKELNASISHCPISNLRLGCGIAKISEMIEKGINISIGTDGQGSGSNASILDNMRATSLLQKGINEDPTLIDAYTTLKMATINGAKALGLEDTIGSIDEGKKANIVIFNLKELNTKPTNDIISSIVYNATSSDIESVLINGTFIMKDKEFNVNKEEIIDKCDEIRLKNII